MDQSRIAGMMDAATDIASMAAVFDPQWRVAVCSADLIVLLNPAFPDARAAVTAEEIDDGVALRTLVAKLLAIHHPRPPAEPHPLHRALAVPRPPGFV